MLVGLFSVGMVVLGECLAKPLSRIFVGYDTGLLELTLRGFAIYSFSFLFAGLAIYGSSFFTALNNGLISALISFLRTLVFQIAAVLIFPVIWDVDGIWFSILAAELMAALVTALFLTGMRKKYHYGREWQSRGAVVNRAWQKQCPLFIFWTLCSIINLKC